MSNETTQAAILAKQALAQMTHSPLASGKMAPIESIFEASGSLPLRVRTLSPTISGLLSGLLIGTAVSSATYTEVSEFGDNCLFVPVCYAQSDSQQLSLRAQRARSVWAVNLQAERHVVRAFDFDEPFPTDESPYSPQMPETPRILKLLK